MEVGRERGGGREGGKGGDADLWGEMEKDSVT